MGGVCRDCAGLRGGFGGGVLNYEWSRKGVKRAGGLREKPKKTDFHPLNHVMEISHK